MYHGTSQSLSVSVPTPQRRTDPKYMLHSFGAVGRWGVASAALLA